MPSENGPLMEGFIGFWAWAKLRPDHPAIIEANGRSASFAQVAAASNQVARAVHAHGIMPGGGVAVLMPNGIEIVEIYLGAMQAGLYFTAINTYLAPAEIAHVLQNCEAGLLIVHERYRAEAQAALADGRVALCLWIGGEADSYTAFKDAQPTDPPEHRTAGQTMIYSSGTTGKPKGIRPALPTEPPEGYNATKAWAVQTFDFTLGEGVHLLNGPLYHAGPLTMASVSLHYGHSLVMLDKWDAETALQLIERHRVTSTFMVPTMFTRLLRLPDPIRAGYDLSSLRIVIHAAAPCPPPVKHAMIAWLGPILFESYGGTEGAGTTCTSAQWLTKPGTVGPPAPGLAIRILDDEGAELPVRQVGNVFISPSFGLPEYFKDPDKSVSVRRGGMFTIGDMGYLDEDGWLFLVDRKSDMLISGGVNIYPAEIEQVLLRHRDVADVAVIGVPSEEWGEAVKAVVQLIDGVEPSAVLEQDIIEFSRTHLARYKVPRSVDFVAALPRAENGKLYKKQIRNKYWADQGRHI